MSARQEFKTRILAAIRRAELECLEWTYESVAAEVGCSFGLVKYHVTNLRLDGVIVRGARLVRREGFVTVEQANAQAS